MSAGYGELAWEPSDNEWALYCYCDYIKLHKWYSHICMHAHKRICIASEIRICSQDHATVNFDMVL